MPSAEKKAPTSELKRVEINAAMTTRATMVWTIIEEKFVISETK
jgi:hypothetical protein